MRFFQQMSRLALPASALAALTVFWYCEPGNSLNPTQPGTSSSSAMRVVAVVTSHTSPSPIALTPGSPTDTAAISVVVTDSATGAPPPAGTIYQIQTSSVDFTLFQPTGTGIFPAGGILPANGQIMFRAHSRNLGPKSLYVTAGSGTGLRQSAALTFNVTGSLAPPLVTETHPAQISPADSADVVIEVRDAGSSALMPNARVDISSSFFTIHDTTSAIISSDTTDARGMVKFLAYSSTIGSGTVTVTVTSPGGVQRTLNLTITVTTQPVLDRPRNMVFTALRPILKADGSDSTLLKVVVKDSNNNPRPDEIIYFTSTGGLVQKTAKTDEWGTAYAALISERANMTVVVTASLPKYNLMAQQTVVFDGVTIKINTSKRVIMRDSIVDVVFEFLDANAVPMSGDTLEILATNAYRGFGQRLANAAATRDSMLVQVDIRGQYKTTITSQLARDVILEARALGARTLDTVSFTNNSLNIASSSASILGNGVDQCVITATLVDRNTATPTPIVNAELRWTTTFGTFVTAPFTLTDGAGASSITLRAPKGSGLATVNAEAYLGNQLIASGNITVRVRALPVERLELKVSPDNIPIRVGVAGLIAQAYDSLDNVMTDVLIGFRLIKGAGGGDEVIDPPVAYSQAGLAQSTIKAGGVISLYQGVKLAAVALDIEGPDTLVIASSDTVGLTISGPPHKVSVGANILKGINPNDGTFQLPTAAVVTDVNGNLVADGTPVNFGVHPVIGHYKVVELRPSAFSSAWYWFRDTVFKELPWTDYNNNRKLDPEEPPSVYNTQNPARGEDKDGDGLIHFGPEGYEDINGDGIWQDGGSTGFAEPTWSWTWCDSTGVYCPTYRYYYDLNYNGRQDTVEPFFRNGVKLTDSTYNAGVTSKCKCTGQIDTATGKLYEETYFGSPANRPYPGFVSVGIDRQVGTLLGKATTQITYVQTDAQHVTVRITAEANGIRSSADVFLPIILGGD